MCVGVCVRAHFFFFYIFLSESVVEVVGGAGKM